MGDRYQALGASAPQPATATSAITVDPEPMPSTPPAATIPLVTATATSASTSRRGGDRRRSRRGGAPTPAAATVTGVPTSFIEDDDGDNDLYYTAVTARVWEEEAPYIHDRAHRHRGSRCCAALAAVLLLLVGLGLVLLGDVQRNNDVLPICPDCAQVTQGLMIGGGVIIAVGLFGLSAACSRRRCTAYTFSALVGVLAVALLLAGVAVTLVHEGDEASDLKRMWKGAVTGDPALVCSLQHKFNCSGFTVNCTGADDSHGQCSSQCGATNNNTATCESPVRTNFDHNLVPVLAVAYGLGLFFAVAAVAGVRMTFVSHPFVG